MDGPGPAAVKASVDEGMSSREPSSSAAGAPFQLSGVRDRSRPLTNSRNVSDLVGCPQGPKKERKKEMGHPRSQHFVLASREIESVTRRVGRWGFSKVYPWNGRIQP